MNKIKIGFYNNGLCERGTTTSMYSYAHYCEKYFNYEAFIFYNSNCVTNNENVINLFKTRFKVYGCNSFDEIDKILLDENISYLYNICGGNKNSTTLVKNSKNLIHAVFTIEPFGDRYAGVSSHLVSKSQFNNCQFVPHMIDLPDCNENLRNQLNIPKDAIIFGRYGGKTTFNLEMVHETIKQILTQFENFYFVFANTDKFYEHKNIIYLDTIVDHIEKVKFINTCDAMIHARSDGETFGIAIGEFSTLNKPVITCKNDLEERNCHIEKKGDRGPFISY